MKLDQASLFDEISKLLSAHSNTGITIVPETRIGADLEIDSVEIFDIVMELEDLYDISFPIEQASNIDTVRDLVATIRQLANV